MKTGATSVTRSQGSLVHEALLYRNTAHLREVLGEFAAEAARGGEPLLVVVPEDTEDLARASVASSGATAHFEAMSERGRNPCCLLDLYTDWVDAHDGPVRIVNEPVWPGRSHAEIVEVLRHEAVVNHLLADRPASLLCPYDAAHLDGETLAGAELTHPRVRTNGTGHDSERYGDPLEILAGTRWPLTPGCEPVTELDFDGDLHDLRDAVASTPIVESLGRTRRADLVFAVNEAVTNAIRHGDGHCTTRLWQEDGAVVTEVVTTSPLQDALVGRQRPASSQDGGRGLWLINQVCDLVQLRTCPEGTSVRMHVRDAT